MTNGLTYRESLKFVDDACIFIQNHFHLGDFYKLNLPFYNVFVVTDPEIVQHILIRNEKKYEKSQIGWGEMRKMIGKALATMEGEEWVEMRRLQRKYFTPAKVQSYLGTIVESNRKFFDELEKRLETESVLGTFCSMHVAATLKILFGLDEPYDFLRLAEIIGDGETIITYRSQYPWRPFLAMLNGKNRIFRSYGKVYEQIAEDAIRENMGPNAEDNLMKALLAESTIMGKERITEKIIRNEIIVHLGAGTETVAVAGAWAIYQLAKHPEILARVRAEIDALNADEIDESHLDKLEYTTWAIKESMRLYPSSHVIMREAVEEDRIGDLKVKKGYAFFMSIYGLQRNPRFWDRADEFIPERFAREDAFKPYTFMPFGAGKHVCLGKYLGIPMIVLSLAEFLRRFDYSLEVEEPVLPLSLTTQKPNRPFRLKLKSRIKTPVL